MKKFGLIMIVFAAFAGCRDKYELELKNTDKSLLVVEGMLNAGQGPTFIRLSQTMNLQESASIKPELNAQVSVEDGTGNVYNFSETGFGSYRHNQLPLQAGNQYRLRIKTTGNKEYLSDFVDVIPSPDIDSITWKRNPDGLIIYANTHDPLNNTRYYKWDFDETYEIRSFYSSNYEWLGDTIIWSPDYRFQCWKYDTSSTLNIASSAQLQSDVINEAPIHFIPNNSEKLSYRYSILVKQQSLSKEAYQYFQLMKKNTESIGSIFDPQPSELKGNIRCVTDPAEGVIGFLTASEFREKRIFITAIESNWSYPQTCYSFEVDNHKDSIRLWVPEFLPYSAFELVPGFPEFYYFAPAPCVDCTKRGGDLAKPSYW